MSRLCNTRTPWMHDSSTCAPWAPSVFPLKSKWNSAVDSLQANPNKRFFSASSGSLQLPIFRCFRLRELVKNCLNDGGISLPFFVLNELWDTFRWMRCVEQPRNSAPNNCKCKQSDNCVNNNYIKQNSRSPVACRSSIYPSAPVCLVAQENYINSEKNMWLNVSDWIVIKCAHVDLIFKIISA